MHNKLKPYLSLVDFIAEFMGKSTEVVLHDLTNWNASIIAIRNGHISGRKLGTPITELSLKILNSDIYKQEPFTSKIKESTENGETIRSSTWYIKDDDDTLIGMLCVNSDCQDLISIRNTLDKMIQLPEMMTKKEEQATENITIDVIELINNNVKHIIEEPIAEIINLSKPEKMDLIKELNAMGTFQVKGAVWHFADIIGVSIPTMYRHIALAKKQEEQEYKLQKAN
jgi:predicted transcriptional regulator YheO